MHDRADYHFRQWLTSDKLLIFSDRGSAILPAIRMELPGFNA
jgi:hypothetical protein